MRNVVIEEKRPEPKIKLIGWRVLVLLDAREIPEGVELPDESVKVQKDRGVVCSLGLPYEGDKPFPVLLGNHVLLSSYAVFEYFEDGREYRIVNCEDLVGILP